MNTGFFAVSLCNVQPPFRRRVGMRLVEMLVTTTCAENAKAKWFGEFEMGRKSFWMERMPSSKAGGLLVGDAVTITLDVQFIKER
jgi:hypothetical protein